MGTLLIPNTLAIIEGAPHRNEAQELVDYLLSAEVETALAEGPSAQIPLSSAVEARSRVVPTDRGDQPHGSVENVVVMDVDYAEAAKKREAAARFLRDEFATAR